MAAPTVIGASVQVDDVSAITIDISGTVPAGCNCIVVGIAGYNQGNDWTPTIYDLTVYQEGSGGAINLIEWDVGTATTQMNCGLFAVYDTDANWPGEGSVTIQVGVVSDAQQLRASMCFLQDVDTSGTPITGSNTGSGNSATCQLDAAISSSTDDLCIGVLSSYPSDIAETGVSADNTVLETMYNTTVSTSSWMWSEAGESGTTQVDCLMDASTSFCIAGASFAGTGGASSIIPHAMNHYRQRRN